MNRLLALAVCSLACVGGSSDAAVAPPAPENGPQEVSAQIVNGQLELRDTRDNFGIIVPQVMRLAHRFPQGITSQIELQAQPTGADLIVTLTNTTGGPLKPGKLSLGIMNLGRRIEYYDFRNEGEAMTADYGTYIGQAYAYPTDLYSPVAVLRNQKYAIGVSIQYPIMEYRHDVMVGISSPPSTFAVGEAGRGWAVEFATANLGDEAPHNRMQNELVLSAGQTRTYVISVRVSRDPATWIQTLVPYRDFFRATYGGVQYERGTSPILGHAPADVSYLSSSNPRGFRPDKRPDVHGWGPYTDVLMRQPGWSSYMLWAPTGLYLRNRALNYPYQFASPLESSASLATAFDPGVGLARIPAAGRELGLWWGRSLEVATVWDPDSMEPFDPENPRHVAAADAELAAAARAGVTLIGLDTFSTHVTPIWKLQPWLARMRERHPQIKFCTEPSQSDILHTQAATFFQGYNDNIANPTCEAEILNVHNQHYLADLILPGHETWLSFAYHIHKRCFGGVPAPATITEQMAHYASLGYRPVFFVDVPLDTSIRAAASWENTLPDPVRNSDPVIAALREQGLSDRTAVRRAPGSGASGRVVQPRNERRRSEFWPMKRIRVAPAGDAAARPAAQSARPAPVTTRGGMPTRPAEAAAPSAPTNRNSVQGILRRLRAVQQTQALIAEEGN